MAEHRVRFKVPMADGSMVEVEGIYAGIGLAIHRGLGTIEEGGRLWRVSHTTSGRRLPGDFGTKERALRYAEAMADAADWEQDYPDILKDEETLETIRRVYETFRP